MTFVLSLVSTAHAFCGYYAGHDGQAVYNDASVVALARDGDTTTLTLANDFQSDASDFALLVPVPQVLTEDAVAELDPGPLLKLDQYSAPRLVSYPCGSLGRAQTASIAPTPGGLALGCADAGTADSTWADTGGEPEATSTVNVEAQFLTGVYEIVILSAEESGDLLTWLADSGYAVPDDAADVLQEYIDSGVYFLVARVASDAGKDGGVWLPPLQLTYTSEQLTLPIRLGTLSSAGEQDMIVYTLTDQRDGTVAIANYAQAEVESECLYAEEPEQFSDFYDLQFTAATRQSGLAMWVQEYAWQATKCDPCVAEPLENDVVRALGGGDARDTVLTRLHLRYRPDQIDQDLVLYTTGVTETTQERFVAYSGYATEFFPVCNVGWIDGPNECIRWETGEGRPGGYLCGGLALPLGGGAIWTLWATTRGRRRRG